MIGRETRMLLRHYLAQGASKSALARQLGIHRDTIHQWIRDRDLERDLDATAVRYGPRPAVPTKLDAYEGIMEARLSAYPQLSAVQCLDEIRAAGLCRRLHATERLRPAGHAVSVDAVQTAWPMPASRRPSAESGARRHR
jgi:transposase